MHKDPNCVFCKIVAGDLPAYKIDEDENFLAILDIAQFVDGHTLVIPKEHFSFVWDIPEIEQYFKFIHSLGNHYRNLGYKYIDTLTLGRMVTHAHVHLIPHNDDNEVWNKIQREIDGIQLDENRKPTPEKLKETQEMFKKFAE
jgi:histidine triad (HIT) family protein